MDADWEQLQPTSPPSASRSALLLLRTHWCPFILPSLSCAVQCVGGHRAGGGVLDRQEGEEEDTCAVVVLTARLTALCCGSAHCQTHCLLLPPLQSSLKVRCVTATCGGQGLSVTTLSRDKRGKGLRIRKEKEGEAGGSIVSLSTTQLLCRPSNKQETLSGQSPCQA